MMNQTASERDVCIALADDPCPTRSARRATRQMTEALGLADAPDPGVTDGLDTAVLVAPALVTTAWHHARGVLEMRLRWNDKALTIEVDDMSHACPVIVTDELRVPRAIRSVSGGVACRRLGS